MGSKGHSEGSPSFFKAEVLASPIVSGIGAGIGTFGRQCETRFPTGLTAACRFIPGIAHPPSVFRAGAAAVMGPFR